MIKAAKLPNRKPRFRDTQELAWSAGFFDGEGYVTCHRGNRHKKPGTYVNIHMDIRQVDRRVLDRFADAVGLKDRVYGPWKSSNPNARPFYTLSVSKSEEVTRVVALLWRWLSPVKRKQAQTAINNWMNIPRLKTGRKRKGLVNT